MAFVTFDPIKSAANERKHGFALDAAERFDLDTAVVREDVRFDYREVRFRAIGWLDERLCFLAFTATNTGIRAISLRKANQRERRAWHRERD